MQAERRVGQAVRLCVANLVIQRDRFDRRIGPAEVPQMDADLVGAAGGWRGFDQRSAVGKSA